MNKTKLFAVGGAAPTGDACVFIERPEYQQAGALLGGAKGVSIVGPRQVGKSTTLNWLARHLEAQAAKVVHIDLSMVQPPRLAAIAEHVIETIAEDWGISNISPLPGIEPLARMRQILKDVVDGANRQGDGRLHVVFLDEVDVLMRLPAQDALAFLMQWRAMLEWAQGALKLVTASVFALDEFFAEANTTGNIMGNVVSVRLPMWQPDANVLSALAQGFVLDDQGQDLRDVLTDVIAQTGGHPATVSLMCVHLATLMQRNHPAVSSRWALLRARLLDPHSQDDPMAGYISNLETQLTAWGRAFYPARLVLLQVMKGNLDVNADRVAIKRLVDIGLLKLDSDSIPHWAASAFKLRINQVWINRIDRQVTARLAELRSRSLPPEKTLSGKDVLILTLGGTIGMTKSADGTISFQGLDQVLAEFSQGSLSSIARLEAQQVAILDGINVRPEHWIQLAQRIHDMRESFDAFVVTHGTDTMAYTASALAFMLGPAFGKPVVFTGSQTTIDVVWGDAKANLARALLAATADEAVPEVQIVFGDQVLRATRAVKDDDRMFQAFVSPAAEPMARVTEGFLRAEWWQPLPGHDAIYKFLPFAADDILFISVAPGVSPQRWRKSLELDGQGDQCVNGIIISTPGAGSLPTEGDYSFKPFIEWAVSENIPVLIISQMPINAYSLKQYAVSTIGTLAGGIPTGNLTLPAAYTKFSWALGRARAEVASGKLHAADLIGTVRDLMLKPYVGEQAEDRSVDPYRSSQ
jgi:L-asparaginase